jgi:hypothetical protein
MPKGLAYCLEDYLNLVDWTSRQFHDDKYDAIAETQLLIL